MQKNNKNHSFKLDLYGVLGVGIFIILWFVISAIINERVLIFPSPMDTFKELGVLLSKKYTYECIGWTLLRVVIGFGIALVAASLFGVLGGLFKSFRKVMAPIVTALKAIPTVSFLFLFFKMVGYDNAPMLVVIFITFPSLYDSVVGGIMHIDENIVRVTRLEVGSLFTKIHKVYFPLAMSYIIVGIISAFGLALKVEIMAEVISASTGPGIGNAIRLARNDVFMAPIFAWTLISVILLLIISILVKIINSKLLKKDN